MTHELKEQHRKRFEELSGFTELALQRNGAGRYILPEIENRWIGYLMHAENQVVELPSAIPFPGSSFDNGFNYAREGIRIRLCDQGIKVKEQ